MSTAISDDDVKEYLKHSDSDSSISDKYKINYDSSGDIEFTKTVSTSNKSWYQKGVLGDIDSAASTFDQFVDTTTKDLDKGITKAVDDVIDIPSNLHKEYNKFEKVVVDLEEFGEEIAKQTGLSGDRQDDEKAISNSADRLEDLQEQLQEDVSGIDDNSFMGEIFTLSYNNKVRDAIDSSEYYTELTRYEGLVDKYEKEYAVGILLDKLAEDMPIMKPMLGSFRIIGGLFNEVDALGRSIDDGELANSLEHTFKIAGIALALYGIYVTIPVCPLCAGFMIAGLVSSLDAAYGNSQILGAVFNVLDEIFTGELLQLDERWGEGWNSFDEDSKYYQDTIAYTQITLSIAAAISSLYVPTTPTDTSATGQVMAATGTASKYYGLLQQAQQINDIVEQYNNLDNLETELRDRQDLITKRQSDARRNKMFKAYREMESMLTDEDIAILNYEYMLYNDPTAVIDPELLIRGNPSTNRSSGNSDATSFGFEELFDYETMNGGSNYTNSMLFG